MCNFAAQLKHVEYREKLVEIQRDNTFWRETLKSSKKARYKPKQQSTNYQTFAFLFTFEKLSIISQVPIKFTERWYSIDCRWCVGK